MTPASTRPLGGLRLARLHPGRLAERVAAGFLPAFAERGVLLVVQTAPELPPFVAEPELVVRALLLLLERALERAERQVVLEVLATDFAPRFSFEPEHPDAFIDRRGVLFSVRDDGPGLEPLELGEALRGKTLLIRDPERADGLPLPVARQIAELHGGVLTAGSRLGAGSRLHFWLPA